MIHVILFSLFLHVVRAQFKSDYEALQARMYSLPDKLTHDVMVWCIFGSRIKLTMHVYIHLYILCIELHVVEV